MVRLSRKEIEMGMDKKEFAKLMLKWSDLKEEMDDIEAVIATEVLEIGKTVDIGYTSAAYSAGRATYAWEQEALAGDASAALILSLSTTTITTKWKDVCKKLGIDEAPVLKAGTPSVTLRLVK